MSTPRTDYAVGHAAGEGGVTTRAEAVGHAAGVGDATALGTVPVEAVGKASSAIPPKHNPALPPRPTRSGKQQNIWDAVAKRHPEGPLPPTALLEEPLTRELGFPVKRDAINRALARRKDKPRHRAG